MANDFIMAEARSGASPEQVDSDTRHFMAAMQRTLQERAAAGETIVVSEAVVAASMPDITPEIRAAVGEFIKRNPPPRVATAAPAPAPAMPGMMPTAPVQAPPAANPVFGGGGLLPGGGPRDHGTHSLAHAANIAVCCRPGSRKRRGVVDRSLRGGQRV